MVTSLSKTALFSTLSLFLCVAPVRAEEQVSSSDSQGQELVSVSTPSYRAYESGYVPRLGIYSYEVSWNGIPAAEATLEMGSDERNYKVVAFARTYSAIDIFYKLRYRAEGLLSGSDLSPLRTVIDDRQNSRVKNTEITFRPDGQIESISTKKGKPTEILRLVTNNFTLDPFGAALLARGLRWNLGDTKSFDTFDGRTRYIITLTATGYEDVRWEGQVRRCIVLEPAVRRLNKGESQPKLRNAKIYLTDDENRDVLKIVSSVFIGSVTTQLVKFEPRSTPSVLRMAQIRATKNILK